MTKRVSIYCHKDSAIALSWSRKIRAWIKREYPGIQFMESKPEAVIVLGGDGTILDAIQAHSPHRPKVLGLNLGHIGFLASAREPKNFFRVLAKFFKGNYTVAQRMMIRGTVFRKGKAVFTTHAINEIVAQSLLGMVEIAVSIENHPVQYVRGSGIMVATATGSTAYNLSAHGPIVMPDIKCMIVTEIMDHNVPTPSIVVKRNREIALKVLNFRKHGLLRVAQTGKEADVVLTGDRAQRIFPLEKGDVIKISRSPGLVKFVEFEKAYFFKSLQEKFAFR